MNTELLAREEQASLLHLARLALEARVHHLPAPTPNADGVPAAHRGAFVTIHHRGDLRGCLGWVEAGTPLVNTVARLAASVADADPRFEPVQANELADIDIEISVLTPPREVGSIAEIEVGRHGLIVEQGGHRGLLLPQVASERGWDRETFLGQTCLKAGLPADAWRAGARILSFEAQVFGE